MAGRFQYSGAGNFDQLFNITNTALSNVDKELKEQAEFDLNNIKNRFTQDVNDYLNSVRESDKMDEVEMQGDLNNFLEKTTTELGNKANDRYYCKNNYTAQRAKQMIQGQLPSLQQKVHEVAWQRQTEHDWQEFNNSFQSELDSGLYAPQTIVDNRYEALVNLKAQGKCSESQFSNIMNNVYKTVYDKAVTTAVTSMFDDGIKTNKSFQKIWEDYEKTGGVNIQMKDASGAPVALDTTEAKDKLKKILNAEYKAKVSDLQDQNSNWHSELVVDMRKASTDSDRLQIAIRGMAVLDRQDGLQMDENRRNYYSALYQNIIDNGGALSKSGSGSKKYLKTLSQFAEENKGSLIADIAAGDIKPEVAKEVLNDCVKRALVNGEIKDYKANSMEDAEGIIKLHGNQHIETFYSDLIDSIFNKDKTGKFAGTVSMLKKLTTDMAKDPELYGETTMGYVNSALIDLVVSNNLQDLTDKDLMDFLSDTVNASYAAKVEALQNKMVMQKDTAGNDTNYFDYKNDKQRKEYLTTATQAAEENDVMYSDSNGIHFKSEADEKAVNKYADNARLEIARSIGVKPEQLKQTWKKDKYGDEIPVPEFTYNGVKYYLETEKDKKGNVSGYKIKNSEGWDTKSYDYDKMKKQANAEAKAESKAKKAAKKAIEKEDQKLWHDREKEAEEILKDVNKQPKAIKGLEDGVWGGLDAKDRYTYVKNAIVDCSKNDKLAQEAVGMTAEEFGKLPFIEQVKLLTK